VKSDVVSIVAIIALAGLGVGGLVEGVDIRFVYTMGILIAAIVGVPVAIPKIMSRIKKHES